MAETALELHRREAHRQIQIWFVATRTGVQPADCSIRYRVARTERGQQDMVLGRIFDPCDIIMFQSAINCVICKINLSDNNIYY